MASNLDAPSKKSDEPNHDDSALEAIASLFGPAAGQSIPSEEEDFELLSDGESIEVLEAAADGVDDPAGSGSSGPEVTGKDDPLAEQNEETEILQELGTLYDSDEEVRRPAEGDQRMDDILEALIALYVDEDQRTELGASEVVIAKVETKGKR